MALKIPEKPKMKSSGGRLGLRVNYLIIFLSGLLILIASCLVFLLIIQNVYGSYELEEILPTKENLERIAYQQKAALLYPQYTENRFAEGSTWVQDNINTWETYLSIIRMDYDIITDLDIELGKHFEYKLLILPGAQSISDQQIRQIKKYMDQGGSVFATGGTASYSDEGKWRGWEFFTEVYGLRFNREIKPDELYKVHTLRGNLPITAEVPTGYALKIATWDRPIYAEVLEPRVTQVSFWYDYRREAGLVREGVQQSAGIAYGTYGKGRFVWYGFELNSVIGKQEDYIYFEKLIRNSVNWLTYNPTSFVKDWPAPYNAAALIIPSIGTNVGNFANSSSLLKSLGYEPTVFVDESIVYNNPSVIRTLANLPQVGVIADIGYLESASDTINNLFDEGMQKDLMKSSKDTLESLTGSKVEGLMPLYGFYNENTIMAMANSGYEFLLTDSLTDRSVPKLEIRGEKILMIITRTARDDYEIIRQYDLRDREFQLYTYEEDIDRLLFEGGLYVLKLHTDAQLLSAYSGVIPDIIKYIKDNNIWLTTIPELQNWWRKKGGLEIRYETRSKRRITVEVSNPKETKMIDFVVQVNLNKKISDIKISSEIINTKLPDYEFDTGDNVLYLYIDELEAGETRIYLVDFKNVII